MFSQTPMLHFATVGNPNSFEVDDMDVEPNVSYPRIVKRGMTWLVEMENPNLSSRFLSREDAELFAATGQVSNRWMDGYTWGGGVSG